MKKLLSLAALFIILIGCNDSDKNTPASENDVDAARNFIKASLDRNWSKARNYLLMDTANMERIEKIESFYSNEKIDDKRGYSEASIMMHNTRRPSDSISIIEYSNSYKNKKDSLKVVKINGQWLVDLKYSFLPLDTVRNVQ